MHVYCQAERYLIICLFAFMFKVKISWDWTRFLLLLFDERIWLDTPLAAGHLLFLAFTTKNLHVQLSGYLWKRDKRPEFSMHPFNHWINSEKFASSNSLSVSIIAPLSDISFVRDFSLDKNLKFVLSSPSSEAKNSGVHPEHAHCDAAPLNTAGSLRFKRWIRRVSGTGSSDILSTPQSWALLISNRLNPRSSAAMLGWRKRHGYSAVQ